MKSEKPKIAMSKAVDNAAELAVDVGTNIFAARTKKGWTQKKLAERLNTLQPSVARVENGNALPSLDFLLRIAKALGTGLIAPTFDSLVSHPHPLPMPKVEASGDASPLFAPSGTVFSAFVSVGPQMA